MSKNCTVENFVSLRMIVTKDMGFVNPNKINRKRYINGRKLTTKTI